ncbi:hypothetical protein EXIGLDRAFT_760746 [Exidia glandulosa HHB12029]|uniref:RRM domain-containing protein n=1 Tax=Exidia glandulosa HHB12029 TaxID=1314781 RepID=A0A165P242_EXIGL|nr:hypothetical protein EXIGLDRAFT_760746 [Exidia glandulosa HHB12029]
MPYTVTVTEFSPATSEQQLHDFFSFCGKIEAIELKEKVALIHFEKPQSANTALMLNGGTLDGAHLSVHSDVEHPDADDHDVSADIGQHDKPRAGIAAEYLAKGYVLSDNVLQRAIELDSKNGISKRFLAFLQSLDHNVGARVAGEGHTLSEHVTTKTQPVVSDAVTRAKTFDEQKGITKTASSYYASAINSPFGQKVFAFYSSTSKQVVDIHEEARRIADAQKPTPPPATTTAPPPTTV